MTPHIAPSLATLGLSLLSLSRYASAQSCWQDITCSGPESQAFPGVWDNNIFAPESRNVTPSTVWNLDSGDQVATYPDTFDLQSDQTGVYLDFGKAVGGIATIEYTITSTNGDGALGVAFSEAKNWTGRNSDSSNGGSYGTDGALYSNFTSTGDLTYTMPLDKVRGAFRYLTLFVLGTDVAVTINSVTVEISFQPTWSNLRAYQGYFHSNDDTLNKIWYSGAYTLQLDAIGGKEGRQWPAPATGWENNASLGSADTYSVDGARRDRSLWPGDMGVSVPAAFYSTGDLVSVKNSLQALFDVQESDGGLQFAGAPLFIGASSATYHLWTMIGIYNYVLYSGDTDFLSSIWTKYVAAMDFITGKIDSNNGLLDVSSISNDWGRINSTAYVAPAQMLLYRVYIASAQLATWVGDTSGYNTTWNAAADSFKTAVQDSLWDSNVGAFRDNTDSYFYGLYPQDGNSLAVMFGLVGGTSDEAQGISSQLTQNWMDIGANCPELPGEISPYISSLEIQAHLLAGQPQRALDLIRTSWGWYLNNEFGTQSTMVEGYLINGTFGYRWDQGYGGDFSYTSHAHGWSTGPVTALTERILGLSVTGMAGSEWTFTPAHGDLTSVEGGFTTSLGQFQASWFVSDGGCPVSYDVNTPDGTKGFLTIPQGACTAEITVDGETPDEGVVSVVTGPGGGMYYSLELGGGNHTLVVS
ncbi:glycoside hydrolase family 78 protein [Xylariaceae sp. FL1272]|nr:glycoside hydrolase family 78 protein [Xylariaceae sp. FL1272]